MIKPRGFALVLVLWVLSLMTIMAGSFALTMRRESALVSDSRNNAQAIAVAESGLALAEFMLLNPDPQFGWRTDGSIYQINYANSKVRIRMLSENGKIDINSADQTLLQELMSGAPLDAKLQTGLVNAILDWRDEDDLVRIEGAEKKDYKKAGLSYQPSNKPFRSIDELQLVLGMNEQIFKWLENLVTVNSGQPKVNLSLAAKEVLQVLPGLDAELIDEFIAARRDSAINGLPAPKLVANNDVYTIEPSAAIAVQPASAQKTAPSLQNIFENNGQATAQNTAEQKGVITVIAEAQLDDGSTADIQALIQADALGSSPFQILKWRSNATVNESLFSDEKDMLLVGQYAEPQFNN